MSRVVDIDLIDTWPAELLSFVAEIAQRLEGTANGTNDLNVEPMDETYFQAEVLTGTSLRTYHCTRLLPHELRDVRTNGLRKLDRELLADRIVRATESGVLSANDAEHLLSGHAFAAGNEAYREDRIWLFASRRVLDDHAGSLWALLSIWGGEAIYFAGNHTVRESQLQAIGTPSVLVAALDMSAHQAIHGPHRGLLRAFVGKLLGYGEYDAVIEYREDIPGSRVIAVWQPGDPEYDRHRLLPQVGNSTA